ncbi:MAG: hypothetical protein IAE66_02460 [Xanthomonadaceae bacterium]|nr:hypothetical protein [Xanthomonadaceae bacterium]
MKAAARFALMLSCCSLLSACGMAVFESPPGQQLAGCDARFVGHWRLVTPEDHGDTRLLYVSIGPECSSYEVGGKKLYQAPGKQVSPVFARVDDQSILALPLASTQPAGEDAPRWERGGYLYFAYRQQGDRLHLYPVLDKTVARLIIDDAMPGRVNVVTGVPPEEYEPLSVFAIGAPERMADIVQRPDLFHKEPMTLVPVAATELPQSQAGGMP